jgi:ATP-dependent Clp protease adaptor protein ClpS
MQDRDTSASVAEPLAETARRQKQRQRQKPRRQPRYNVILWNDDDHTYDYVVAMLMQIFGFTWQQGYQIAEQVDHGGKAVVLTTTLEHAELKRDQIHAFGKDGAIDGCLGSMWSTVEAVDG